MQEALQKLIEVKLAWAKKWYASKGAREREALALESAAREIRIKNGLPDRPVFAV